MSGSVRVLGVSGPAWVQDLGRIGHMSEGVPWGGALVPELLIASNVVLGNPPGAAGIELFGRVQLAPAPGVRLALDGQLLEPAAEIVVAPAAGRRVGYLAVAGGVAVAPCLGGRGTLPVAALGGFQGRSLQAGDELPVGNNVVATPRDQHGRIGLPDPQAPTPVWPGPAPAAVDAAQWQQAWTTLLSVPWRVGRTSDRSGTRLEGPVLDCPSAPDAPSLPMCSGVIQVPPNGTPIVLGPDHPVTGGYPVIGVVPRAALGSLQMRLPGQPVNFVAARSERPA